MNPASAGLSADEDHGRTSEEEEGAAEQSYDRQVRNGCRGKPMERARCGLDGFVLKPCPVNLDQ